MTWSAGPSRQGFTPSEPIARGATAAENGPGRTARADFQETCWPTTFGDW
jgi:hypothetical protein